ncbi:MAG: hypothetical protein K2J95_05760 [Lachnospiraceae bacterium]|nr:hypothetical protein [Lachnospiraceae bacterium]
MKKREILSIIDSLEKINTSVTKNLESNIPVTTEVLADCQDAAIQIGNTIEKQGQEVEEIVHMLEAYCENIYQMNCVQADTNLCRKLTKKIQKQLVQIRNRVNYDLPDDKKQVVFLPYKASMWDSLESVWKAADADPNCDAYVIPIPYFDKNPDGSVREMHYEGDLYPEYVPIVSWQQYDIAAEHPDVIYIHNPYDEYNLVTSVHPAYYSKELKKYTDELVYIPYFILREIEPDDQAAVQGMEHFCIVPAVVYADKVIVQSEKMRQIYINVMTKTMGEDTRKIWEKKIFGSGSPKVEKLLNTKKEDLEIPEEWRKIIEKPDRSWKKIVFYNIGVSALLAYGENVLRKMESVFGIFKENQDEVALLWRPHPLIKATIESMRPQLWLEYEKLLERYQEEGWGIYDDSADVDRAIILSDAYYGNHSSVVQLCQQTGKKIAIQNDKDILDSAEIINDQEKVYLLTRDTQSLFEYSISSGTLRLCGMVQTKLEQTFISATLYENKIYIPPYAGDCIRVYDICQKKFHSILLTQSTVEKLNKKYYQICFGYGGKVYILGGGDSVILSVDVRNETVQELSNCHDGFKKLYGYEAGVYIHKNVCIVENCFWVPMSCDNILLQYDMQKDECYFWNVGLRKMQYATINFDGKYFWLTGNQKVIVRWEKESDSVKEFEAFPTGFECSNDRVGWDDLFLCGFLLKDQLYYAPLDSNMVIKFDTKKEKMECILKIDSDHVCLNMEKMNEDTLYLEEYDSNPVLYQTYLIDSKGKCEKISPCLSEKDDVNVLVNCIEQRTEMLENHPNFLKYFLNQL